MGDKGRTFVIGMDHTQESTKACEWVRDHLLQKDDKVHLLTVAANPIGVWEPWVPGIAHTQNIHANPTEIDKIEKKEHDTLESLSADVFRDYHHEVEVVRELPTAKRVASVLCDRSKEIGAEALVVAQHRRSALANLFVGSTVACAASMSTVPLLIVP